MPTIREKISQLTSLTAPVTIRQALNQAPTVSSFLGGDKDLNIEDPLEINVSNVLTAEIEDTETLTISNNTETLIIDTIETETC